MTPREPEGGAAVQWPQATPKGRVEASWPAAHTDPDQPTPTPWATLLTCPSCEMPEALVLFDGVGTVCRECGESTRVVMDGSEESS